MLNNKQKITLLGATLLFFQPFSLAGATTIASADTVEQNQATLEPEVVEIASPELFEEVQENTDELLDEQTTLVEDGEITVLVDENDIVRATEIINEDTDEQIVITNTGDNVVIETTTDINGEQQTLQEIYPIIQESLGDNLAQNKLVYGGWTYTHLAVGRTAFAAVAGFGISKIAAAFAAMFSISGSAASICCSYMGIKSGMNASNLAKHLDSNGNGWIALYKRTLRYYKGGNIIGYEHRTY